MDSVKCEVTKLVIPTYPEPKAEDLSMFAYKNAPYIELMTGVYTDNQPDLRQIAPYKAGEFEMST